MPIERYTSIDQVPATERWDPEDTGFMTRLFAFLSSQARQLPPLFEPGLYKYRSIEEAYEDREAALIARARSARKETARGA